MYSLYLRNVFSLSSLRLRTFSRRINSSAKCIPHTREFMNNLLKHEDVKKLFDRLQNDEWFLTEYSEGTDSLVIKRYLEERKEVLDCLQSLSDLEKAGTEDDKELKNMLDNEYNEMKEKLLAVEEQLLDAVVPKLPNSHEVILEINAGVGGQEAMLFAKSLYDMYCGFINYKNWSLTTEEVGVSDLGGLRHASLFIEGENALTHLGQESGVHRVQRVPATEKAGRIHTSTVAVAVLRQPKEIDVNLSHKDLIIETSRASGAGGQHVNKTDSAVRIVHVPTGVSVECQTERSQVKNKAIAFQKLYAKLYSIQFKEQTESVQTTKKMQIGTSSRSDKVRTYNFPQDRITDHRISKTLHNIPLFLEGGHMLDSLISDLIAESEKMRFEQFILNLKKNNAEKS